MKIRRIILSIIIGLSAVHFVQAQNISDAPKKAKTLLAEAASSNLNFANSEANSNNF